MSNEDIIRAWKDEEYRNSLSEEQLKLLPDNPAGIAELSDEVLQTVVGGMRPRDGGGGGTGCGTGGNCTKCDPCSGKLMVNAL
ncbi:mersacidin/lichenicidin family type 2 lantibiotic [Pleurocapsales cyanobacterium LEGE 06147]|nr:mersacidin/lichenicidin family type 2 lantibiotic [Pleurocapsales cyanobacterium LEGE 06147]